MMYSKLYARKEIIMNDVHKVSPIALMLMVHLLQSKQETLIIDMEELATKRVITLMKTPAAEESQMSFT